jgi:hypothetical protein
MTEDRVGALRSLVSQLRDTVSGAPSRLSKPLHVCSYVASIALTFKRGPRHHGLEISDLHCYLFHDPRLDASTSVGTDWA